MQLKLQCQGFLFTSDLGTVDERWQLLLGFLVQVFHGNVGVHAKSTGAMFCSSTVLGLRVGNY